MDLGNSASEVLEAVGWLLGSGWQLLTDIMIPGLGISFASLFVGLFLAGLGLRFFSAILGASIGSVDSMHLGQNKRNREQ